VWTWNGERSYTFGIHTHNWPHLQKAVLVLNKEHSEGMSNFIASTDWMDYWKENNGVGQLSSWGEKLLTDAELLLKCRTKL